LTNVSKVHMKITFAGFYLSQILISIRFAPKFISFYVLRITYSYDCQSNELVMDDSSKSLSM